jgi:hypothetical protein
LSVQISITIPKTLYDRLVQKCQGVGLPIETCIIKGVIEMVEREEKAGVRK